MKLWRAKGAGGVSGGANGTGGSGSGGAGGASVGGVGVGATSGAAGTINVKPVHSFEEATDYVYDVRWHPVNPAVFGSVDGTGKFDLWNLNVDTEVSSRPTSLPSLPTPSPFRSLTPRLFIFSLVSIAGPNPLHPHPLFQSTQQTCLGQKGRSSSRSWILRRNSLRLRRRRGCCASGVGVERSAENRGGVDECGGECWWRRRRVGRRVDEVVSFRVFSFCVRTRFSRLDLALYTFGSVEEAWRSGKRWKRERGS